MKKSAAIVLFSIFGLLLAAFSFAMITESSPAISVQAQDVSKSGAFCGNTDELMFGPCEAVEKIPSILVFSKTDGGYRHDSIVDGKKLIVELAEENNFTAEFSEDSTIFQETGINEFDAVMFLNTEGAPFINEDQKVAFKSYIQAGHGFVGIHSAASTHNIGEADWDWYRDLVGELFLSHPPGTQDAVVKKTTIQHPSTDHLAPEWTLNDEWYNFAAQPKNVEVLLTLDETTYDGGTMGTVHPIAWKHEFEGARVWYTGLGHTKQIYQNTDFQDHVLGGILWVLGL